LLLSLQSNFVLLLLCFKDC